MVELIFVVINLPHLWEIPPFFVGNPKQDLNFSNLI